MMPNVRLLTAFAAVLITAGPAWALDAVEGSVRATPRPAAKGPVRHVVVLKFSNLPWAYTQEDLVRLVQPYGTAVGARIATDRETGRSRGFGFVELPREQAERVLHELDGTEIAGRFLKIETVETPQNPERFPGRR